MPFVSVISQKGGSGKSTLAVHLAVLMARYGHKTLLIDADVQASSMAWYACRVQNGHPAIPNLTIMAITNATITGQMAELTKAYDLVVVDAPPRTDNIARDVILASDIALVPTQPSAFDVWAADTIIKTIEELRPIQKMAGKRPLDYFCVVNKKDPRTVAGRAILKALEKSGAPMFDTHLCNRASFVESVSQGLTVLETDPAGSKARTEIELLGDELRLAIHRRQQERAAA